MYQTLTISRRRRGSARRLLAAPALGLLAAAIMLLSPALASADSGSTLTIVGTSDVSDSGLVPNLIQPEFQAAYPQFTFKYSGTSTLNAIKEAENGSANASVLIVHAASLENQFVAGGFSYNNQYGNALFTNDFILAGPTGDPAGVAANAGHNIVQAYEDIAIKGYNGGSGTPGDTFVSRGGGPGTTVAEHGIWALVAAGTAATPLPGIQFCAVDNSLGGGETPIAAGSIPAVTAYSGNPCPAVGGVAALPSGAQLPDWYIVTGVNQGPNVVAASNCTVNPGTGTNTNPITSGANSCYVFSDRGTFDYLASGNSPSGGASVIPNLTILTRQNSATAPGGANELTNYFHAYIINPNVAGETVNVTAAQDFINFVTSPTVQAQLKTYLANTGDPEGPPFVADASPGITLAPSATTVAGGKAVTISGTVTNSQPGYAVPSGQAVKVSELFGTLPIQVAAGTTDASGNYAITFTPPSSGSYQVSTGSISQIEIPTLSPAYGDILSPGASTAVALTVQGGVTISSAVASTGGATVTGTVSPAPIDGNGTVTISARLSSSKGAFTTVGSEKLAAGQTTYSVSGNLKPGTYTVQATYGDGLAFAGATSPTSTVNVVPAKPFSPSYKKLSVKNGKLTLTGTLNNATYAAGATIRLYGLKTVKLAVKKTTKGKIVRVERTAAVAFKQIAKTTVKKGNKSFTIKVKLTRDYRWILQLQFVQKGQTWTYSKVRYLDVH